MVDEQGYVSGYAGRMQNVFSDFICSEVERIDWMNCGLVFPLSLCRKVEL